ncbi:MAG: immunoglobulin domain-containing protein [Verrucomicrobia bacterium]|nr:immunoglobulin domain-containing protein [Verrucomicrobiota bacterium]
MKLLSSLWLRCHWLHLPGAVLIALLQRTPVLRLATLAEERLASSPLGSVLRSAFATTASLGVLHTLAGATQLTASTASPLRATVGTAIPTVAMTVTGAQTPPGSFLVTGPIPAGLAISGLTGNGGTFNGATLTMTGTPTAAGTYAMTIRAWEKANRTGDVSSNFTYTVVVSAPASAAPSISAQPASRTVDAGASVTFAVTASGSPAPVYQWLKDGATLAAATNATLTIAGAQPTDAGTYTVVVSNPSGSLTSSAAVLTVNVPTTTTPVTFAAQPAAQVVTAGSTVVFNAPATGATSYQWNRNGTAVAGATSPMLVVNGATAAQAGTYTVVASNGATSVTSNAAALTLATAAPVDIGHIVNLSILTPLALGETMTMGTVLGGAGTVGNKALLARVAGPSLAPLGVAGVLPDPQMSLVAAGASAPVATNNDWLGAPSLSTAFAQVGAFAYMSSFSKDAALYQPALAPGGYSVLVSDATGAAGTVIAELYDETPSSAFTATTPRLINVSVLKNIATGATLTAGFVIGGTTSRTVLVRAIGPGLAQFGLSDFMADPKLVLSGVTASNDNWGGDPQITAAGNAVGAFAIAAAASKDAMLLVTLPPGAYTAQVSGTGPGGTAIVEVYEVP